MKRIDPICNSNNNKRINKNKRGGGVIDVASVCSEGFFFYFPNGLPQLPQVVITRRMAMSGELFSGTTRSISENVIPPSRGGGSLGHQLAANHRVQRVVEAEGEPESDC